MFCLKFLSLRTRPRTEATSSLPAHNALGQRLRWWKSYKSPRFGVRSEGRASSPCPGERCVGWRGCRASRQTKHKHRAPRKHLPPGSLPIFQAYLQAMAQQSMSVMCSATRKAEKWRGWQIERWFGRSCDRCRRGCGSLGWGQLVTVQGCTQETFPPWSSSPDCQQTPPRISERLGSVWKTKCNRNNKYLRSKSNNGKQPVWSSQDCQVQSFS